MRRGALRTLSDAAITVDGLGKSYRIGALQRDQMLRTAIANAARRLIRPSAPNYETIWALRDVSFSVGRDEVVGVIGHNGSGKTTLLKLLARITYATEGSVDLRGRVAPLVEVGTGFHKELTGRENVYLNGSILGLKRHQIKERFDDIVEFSGIGAFIDTPVKRYSTGMYLRLGFAVAAHLFPDILLVDEVLAVGDAEFQEKCLRTLGEVGRGGNTVLFVSHNLEAIRSLCPRTLWIDGGRLRMDGPSSDVVAAYLREGSLSSGSSIDLSKTTRRVGSGEARFQGLEYLDADGRPMSAVHSGDAVTLRLRIEVERAVKKPYFGLVIHNELGTLLTHPNSWTAGLEIASFDPGSRIVDLHIERLGLMPGNYTLTLWMNRHKDSESVDYLDHCATLNVHSPGEAVIGRPLDRLQGAVFFDSKWSVQG